MLQSIGFNSLDYTAPTSLANKSSLGSEPFRHRTNRIQNRSVRGHMLFELEIPMESLQCTPYHSMVYLFLTCFESDHQVQRGLLTRSHRNTFQLKWNRSKGRRSKRRTAEKWGSQKSKNAIKKCENSDFSSQSVNYIRFIMTAKTLERSTIATPWDRSLVLNRSSGAGTFNPFSLSQSSP